MSLKRFSKNDCEARALVLRERKWKVREKSPSVANLTGRAVLEFIRVLTLAACLKVSRLDDDIFFHTLRWPLGLHLLGTIESMRCNFRSDAAILVSCQLS